METGNLVFTRNFGESFTIFTPSGNVVITLLADKISINKAKVKVTAPKDFKIMRNEIINTTRDKK